MDKFTPYQHSDDAGDPDSRASGLSFSQMLAAGVASLAAAVVTSRFGVAGTVLGAALTTMIITGGSTIIKSYLETLHKQVQSVPQRIREGRTRHVQTRTRDEHSEQTRVDEPHTGQDTSHAAPSERRGGSEVPGGMMAYGRGRGGGAEGFFGKLRSSLGWFSGLPGSRKRNVLLGAAVPTVIVFFVAMTAVTGVEVISGRTLSCLTSGACQTAAPGSTDGTSNTTFGEIASLSNDSSGGGDIARPAGDQNDSQSIVPGQDSSSNGNDGQSIVPGQDSSGGQGTQESGGSGFFGQPSGSDSGAGNSSGSSGSGVPSDPSGTGTPSSDQQEVVPSDSSGGAVQEQPVEEAVPQEVQPSAVPQEVQPSAVPQEVQPSAVPQEVQPSGAEQVPTQ